MHFTVTPSKNCFFDLIICTQYLFFSMSLIFSVFLLVVFWGFLCVFLLNWFLSLKFANYVIYAWFSVQDPDTIIIFCMYNSACKPVQTTKSLWKCWQLYLLSHVDSVSLSTGPVSSKYLFKRIIGTMTAYLSPNFNASKTEKLDNETAWYTCLLRWWPLCKRCICTIIRVSWRISNLDWLLLYFVQKMYFVE